MGSAIINLERSALLSPCLIEPRQRAQFLFGKNEKMRLVKQVIEQVSDTDISVLIRGESGTGKELVARELVARSSRRDSPFVKLNCAAIPAELMESELFGYEKGSFTGALNRKPGKFELANHGTIFLDEISEMPVSLQAKLLHVLNDKEFSRLGGDQDVEVDVRVITATNRNLEEELHNGQFREDLYYRVNVVSIQLPPLRERKEDLPELIDYFLSHYSLTFNKKMPSLSKVMMSSLLAHHWPGNVRELENVIKKIVVLENETLALAEINSVEDYSSLTVPLKVEKNAMRISLKTAGKIAAREAERELILGTLSETRWNRKKTAELLDISYKALLYKIKQNNISRKRPTHNQK
jgi:two-component system response regulator AtoC